MKKIAAGRRWFSVDWRKAVFGGKRNVLAHDFELNIERIWSGKRNGERKAAPDRFGFLPTLWFVLQSLQKKQATPPNAVGARWPYPGVSLFFRLPEKRLPKKKKPAARAGFFFLGKTLLFGELLLRGFAGTRHLQGINTLLQQSCVDLQGVYAFFHQMALPVNFAAA